MLVTGAGGQLGRALAEEFAGDDVVALTREDWDVTLPPPRASTPGDLVLHAAAWTDVDAAEDDPQGAAAVNVGGTANVAALGAPLVYYSTDYVFDGPSASRTSSRTARTRSRPTVARSCTGRQRRAAGVDRALVVALRADRAATSSGRCCGLRPSGTKCPSSTISAARRPTSAISPPPPGRSSHLPYGVYHVAAEGDATWADFAEAIFEEAGLDARVRRVATAELVLPEAPRPAYSVVRSEKGAPLLPHWRDGLRECLDSIRTAERYE